MQRWGRLFVRAGKIWLDHDPFLHAGALAFYTLFSLAPVVIIAEALVGALLGTAATRERMQLELQAVIGSDAAQAITAAATRARLEGGGVLPTLFGAVVLLVAATSAFAQLQSALNRLWGVRARRDRSRVMVLLRTRLRSLAVVLTIGGVLLLFLVASIVLQTLLHSAATWLPQFGALLTIADLAVTLGITTLLFGAIYQILPDVRIAWRDVWMGAGTAALLFALGRHLIALYLSAQAVAATFGGGRSLVLVLLWVFYSALILLFGAALSKAHALEAGRGVAPRGQAVRVREQIVDADS